MKKIWIPGAEGMLGEEVVKVVNSRGYRAFPTSHSVCNIGDTGQVYNIIRNENPDAIINCAGRLPGSPVLEMLEANVLGPHILSIFKVPLIHVSTDCVFGDKPLYHHSAFPNFRRRVAEDLPAPDSFYGKTKLAGEPFGYHVTVVRTSFIGTKHGLLAWLLAQKGQVQGWGRAYWTGSVVTAVASSIVDIMEKGAVGTIHLASTEKVSKFQVLEWWKLKLSLPIVIESVDNPWIDRALEPTPGWELPPMFEAFEEYAQRMLAEVVIG